MKQHQKKTFYSNSNTAHTSCSSNIESKVSLDEVIKSAYATLTVSSDSQNEAFTDSCRQITTFGYDIYVR